MRYMRRHSLHLIAIVLLSMLVAGCASRNPRPNAAETNARHSASSGSNSSDQYYVPTAPANEVAYTDDTDELGLQSRGSGYGTEAINATNVAGGPNPNAIANVYFDYDKSSVSADQRNKLQEVAEFMQGNPNVGVLVEGHCDWRGTVEYNLALGERRAKSVASYLANLGVSGNRIETLSKGDLEAIVEGTKQEMAQDRRADVVPVR